jgi:hypothetical protein
MDQERFVRTAPRPIRIPKLDIFLLGLIVGLLLALILSPDIDSSPNLDVDQNGVPCTISASCR